MFFFKQKTAYEIGVRLVGSEMCIRDRYGEGGLWVRPAAMWAEVVERDGRRQPRFAYIGE